MITSTADRIISCMVCSSLENTTPTDDTNHARCSQLPLMLKSTTYLFAK